MVIILLYANVKVFVEKNKKQMTNNKQQTAVEWLFNELERIDKVYYRNTIIYTDARKEAYEKAKEMAKEQAIKLYYEYELYVMMNESDVMTFGQFYKQTYGGCEP